MFGQPLADVDLWEEMDENPFARPEVQDNLGFRSPSNDHRPRLLKSPERKKNGSSTRSKSRGTEQGDRNSPSKSSSSSKRASSSATFEENPGVLVPELTPFPSTSEDSRNKSRHSHGGRSKSSSSSSTPHGKVGAGDDKIGELMELLKRETTGKTTDGSSSRKDKSSRSGTTSDRSGDSSLRQKLMKDSSDYDSPSRRRTPSSVVSESASGRKSSSKRDGSRSSQASIQSWDEHGSSEHRHRRSGSRRSGHRSSKDEGDEGGLDLFMKGTHGRSSRGDAEHRSVVSAPAATTSTEELSKRCQKLNLNF